MSSSDINEQIDTPRLKLREIQPEDFGDVHSYLSNPDLMKYQVSGPNTEAETIAFISKKIEERSAHPRLYFDFAVIERETENFLGLGAISVKNPGSAVAFVTLGFKKAAQGKGYALETFKALVSFGFRRLHMHRIEATCFEENVDCVDLMLAGGMKLEGTVRENLVCKGRRWSIVLCAILKHEHSE